MRRRRFPRRPIRPRPGMRPGAGRRPIPPKLHEAHRSFEMGDYQRAAELYLELAEKALVNGLPQAPNLFLRGAAALLKAGDSDHAMEVLKRGLGILVDRKKWGQLKKAAQLTMKRLIAEGQEDLAAQVQDWVEGQVPEEIKRSEMWRMTASHSQSGKSKLPATCGQCGGPADPNEVEWFGRGQASCSYCGAVLE